MNKYKITKILIFILAFAGLFYESNFFGDDLMPFYTGKVIPTPLRATYNDEFIPLDNVVILIPSTMKETNILPRMIADRIIQHGGKIKIAKKITKRDFYETVICLNSNFPEHFKNMNIKIDNIPQNEEGYYLDNFYNEGKYLIFLGCHTKSNYGLTWAAVSLIQLITDKEGKCVARKATILDYPQISKRGFITNPWSISMKDVAFFAASFKFNRVVFTTGEISGKNIRESGKWRQELPQEFKNALKETAKLLNPLGIEWYFSICPVRGKPEDKIRSKNEEDFKIILENANAIAKLGGNIMLLYDDTRFPISSDDMKCFGNAREADIYFVNKLYKALKKKYPKIKMIFCPPFYWGPQYNPSYPEDRDEYLKAIGERLPKEIGIFWTGPAVGSSFIAKKDVEWVTNLIKRKPWFWQNGTGSPHMFKWHYVSDPVEIWSKWYYEGFFNDTETYCLNTNMPHEAAALITLSDYMWNPNLYNPQAAIEEAVKKLIGHKDISTIKRLNETLSYFDVFSLKVSPVAAKNIEELKVKLSELENVWKEALKGNSESIKKWTSLERFINKSKSFVTQVAKNPDLSTFFKQEEEIKEIAAKETDSNFKKDVFLSPFEFKGGYEAKPYTMAGGKRLATWIYGAKTNFKRLVSSFMMPEPSGSYKLVLSASNDESEKQCKIKITINDNKIFEGENPFGKARWTLHHFEIPRGVMKEGNNILIIENIEDSEQIGGAPYFMLNYAVIKNY